MLKYSFRLWAMMFTLLMASATTAQATNRHHHNPHYSYVSQGEVLAAKRAAENAERTAAALLSQAASARARADAFRAQAQSAPPRARFALLSQASYWSNVANALLGAARFWTSLAAQANNLYQALLRRFQTTTCRLLPNLPLCSVSRN